jgi:hypothetical protein
MVTVVNKPPQQGFSLPITLVTIGSLLLLLICLMAVTRLERKSSASHADSTRAELALESGLSEAISVLSEAAARDDSLIFRIDAPARSQGFADQRPDGNRERFLSYAGVFESGKWQLVPLFSEGSRKSAGGGAIDVREVQDDVTRHAAASEPLIDPTTHDRNIPFATWTEMQRTDASANRIRYAYWVEDLGGRIDARHAGKTPRSDGKSIREISLSTIFNPLSAWGATPQVMLDKSEALKTTASLRHFLNAADSQLIEPYVIYLPDEDFRPKMIPQGYGYADAGKPAPDLNRLVASRDVERIAQHIARNLPNFSSRKGGLHRTEDYLKTLAASIIDYADTDQDATLGQGYRGVDSYPFLNEWFDRFEWVPSADGQIHIRVESFIELWNPSQQAVEGTVSFVNRNRQKIMIPPAAVHEFADAEFGPVPIQIPPNGFSVIPLGARIHAFPEGSFKPTQLNFIETEVSNFSLFWNQQAVDHARGGVQRTAGLLRGGSSERKWKGIASPAHDLRIGQYGDPRASYYIRAPVIANSYDVNSNWGGRALKREIARVKPTLPYAEVRIDQWPDGGSSSLPGIRPTGDSRRPGTSHIINSNGTPYVGSAYPACQGTHAPARISNSGRYDSLCELGNIFDPAQWSDVNLREGVVSSAAGGGFTLAIGRPEFPVFDDEGKRAAQLLDLFRIGMEEGGDGSLGRLININTAPREVLRALVAGVAFDADPLAPTITLKHAEALGDLFADRIIWHRNQSPFRSVSDLNLLGKVPDDPKPISFFGNPSHYTDVPVVPDTDDSGDLISWNDAGREELMAKVADLVTFHSKTFRVVVAGEVLSGKGKRLARATRELYLTIEPGRDANGIASPDQQPRIIKHYEKSH